MPNEDLMMRTPMEEKGKVMLHGYWASPYSRWVKIALKIKGIPYEYVEESMKKKNQLLLQYNPIHKKVPVLVHNGKPIVESLLILEYIDETWKGSPRLMPSDPYSRSMVRFWADFMLYQLDMSFKKVIISQGSEEEESIKEVEMQLNSLEENIKCIFPYDPPSNEEDMGMLDLLISTFPNIIKAIEDAFSLKLLVLEKYPLTCLRMSSLCGLKVIKDTAPPHEKMIKFFQAYRMNFPRS